VTASLIFLAASPAFGQEQVRLAENMPVGTQYVVSCRADVKGSLTLPLEKGEATPKTLSVSGASTIDYYERVLTLNPQKQVKTTLRMYRKLEFERKVGDQKQATTLRPEVRRMVILRQNQIEVPFSPDGPMTWNELDLVRTDVFTPALTGLLPTQQVVKVNDRWQATAFAVQELTDLDKIEEGSVTCQFDQVLKQSGRRQARVSFKGAVKGVGEDGPTRHSLEGYLLFDLESNLISSISVRGAQQLLDKDGKVLGKIEGTFALSRRLEGCKELADDAIRTLKLEPNDDNTQLMYENPEMSLRLLHPRRWRIAGVRGRQLGLDENSGSGLLQTVEPLKDIPTPAQFLQETKTYLEQQKAKILRVDPVRNLQGGAKSVDHFALEVEIGGQRVMMSYFILRQANGGATIAARVLPAQQKLILQDLEKIARSIEIR
jgi:hypothetical protein